MFDPVENGLSDGPDFDNLEDEAFPPLPAPFSPGEGDPNGEEGGEVSKLAEVPAAKRRGVKRPQPKLDSQRLISERGLPTLRTLFDNVRFKGQGHEADDLRLLMQKMENWAHRLYPKLQFEEFIDKLETLGGKKEVQTCLKRIRLDMPLTHEDFMGNDDEEETQASREGRIFTHDDQDPFGDGGFPDNFPGLVPSTPAAPALFPSSQAGPAHSTPAPVLTEEQRTRIERNKQLALERRLARLQQHTDDSQSQPMTSSQSADCPSPSTSSSTLQHFPSQSAEGSSLTSSIRDREVGAPDQAPRSPEEQIKPHSPMDKGAENSSQSSVPDLSNSHSNNQSSVPDVSNNQSSVPDVSNNQSSVPDVSNNQSSVPDVSNQSNHQSSVPDVSNNQSSVPDVSNQSNDQSSVPDVSNNQSSVPDVSNHQSSVPDVSNHQSSVPDVSNHQSSVPDVSNHQSSVPDVSNHQSSVPDVSNHQSSVPDVSNQSNNQGCVPDLSNSMD
ncbi:hypothetical protein UPYG_G00088960 [Umbra pygmaea]|uniref:TIMELESS-interacting protein n=1 Tax=Umbra pygmaea TaxID=75934 RepID=A0ABD0XZQ7_UMBPY